MQCLLIKLIGIFTWQYSAEQIKNRIVQTNQNNPIFQFQTIFWEAILLEIKKLLYLIKPPCPKCPYTLGQVEFVYNPCPNCKLNNYQMYYIFTKNKYMS